MGHKLYPNGLYTLKIPWSFKGKKTSAFSFRVWNTAFFPYEN